MKKKTVEKFPSVPELESELCRERKKKKFRSTLRSTVFGLITVAALVVLAAVFFLPVFRIYGHSMTPGLDEGDIVIAVKDSELESGDVIAFYYNNKILVKRVIAGSGDWVDIRENGDVYVNQERLEEPYLQEKALGECDLQLPYQVPDSVFFVMGDHRSVSADSRSTAIGCVPKEQVAGRLMFRIWPLEKAGFIK